MLKYDGILKRLPSSSNGGKDDFLVPVDQYFLSLYFFMDLMLNMILFLGTTDMQRLPGKFISR